LSLHRFPAHFQLLPKVLPLMARTPQTIALVLGLALGLGACSGSAPLSDSLPTGIGGLPAGAPARPATPYQYPAVHDMPPPRATTPLTESEQQKLEAELEAARDRQEGRPDPAKKPAAATKKKPAAGNNAQNTGAKGNP
jgi:hypothetical protein